MDIPKPQAPKAALPPIPEKHFERKPPRPPKVNNEISAAKDIPNPETPVTPEQLKSVANHLTRNSAKRR